MEELPPSYRPGGHRLALASQETRPTAVPESSSMSAGEAAELPSFRCFFGLLGLD